MQDIQVEGTLYIICLFDLIRPYILMGALELQWYAYLL